MFAHLMLGANDIEQSRKFYDATLAALGVGAGERDPRGRYFYRSPSGVLIISLPLNGAPASYANGGTVAFNAVSAEAVEAWHAAGIANGGATCEDPPGVRRGTLYLAYLRDPAGNKLCAVHRLPS